MRSVALGCPGLLWAALAGAGLGQGWGKAGAGLGQGWGRAAREYLRANICVRISVHGYLRANIRAQIMRANNARRQCEHNAPRMQSHIAGVTRQGPQTAARIPSLPPFPRDSPRTPPQECQGEGQGRGFPIDYDMLNQTSSL